jgi:hypothetical protein
MVVRSESVFLSELGVPPLEHDTAQTGAVSPPVSDNPIAVFRGFAFGIAFQVVAALLAYGIWQLLHHLF